MSHSAEDLLSGRHLHRAAGATPQPVRLGQTLYRDVKKIVLKWATLVFCLHFNAEPYNFIIDIHMCLQTAFFKLIPYPDKVVIQLTAFVGKSIKHFVEILSCLLPKESVMYLTPIKAPGVVMTLI